MADDGCANLSVGRSIDDQRRLRRLKWRARAPLESGIAEVADELNIPITVCHLPPGTSKWNKIEHRLFSFITQNWRGKPLRSIQAIVELIGATTTKTGLKVRAELDQNFYPKGIEVTDAELAEVDLRRHDFHGDWNYTISPRHQQS